MAFVLSDLFQACRDPRDPRLAQHVLFLFCY